MRTGPIINLFPKLICQENYPFLSQPTITDLNPQEDSYFSFSFKNNKGRRRRRRQTQEESYFSFSFKNKNNNKKEAEEGKQQPTSDSHLPFNMVQRNKPINNLNLFQPSDKKMLIKPYSPNYQDHSRTMMNRGPSDLLNKNKIKKSRSTEIPEPPGKPPNYMKSTNSFDAKKDTFKTLRKTTSFKSPRVSTKKNQNTSVLINRDTCSSTLKDSKFPTFIELAHGGTQLEGTSVFKVCHYTYCSLNGHHHHNPPLPPLNRFISSKRQQILKTHCLSPPTATTGGDLDIPSTDNESDMSEEDLEKELVNTHQTSNPACLSPPPERVDDLDFPNTDIESELSETLEMEMEEGLERDLLKIYQTSPPPETAAGDQLEIPSTNIESEQTEALEMEMEDVVEKEIMNLDESLEEFHVEKSIDEGQLEEVDEIERNDHDHMKMAKSDRGAVEEMEEEQKGFNPKQPNYLDVESGPETEKVDLRHQELDDKKNSEEWMLDYAIQQAVNKLGSVRKKRVGLLVEAFEKVIPTHQFDHHRSISSSPVALNHSRPIIQACI